MIVPSSSQTEVEPACDSATGNGRPPLVAIFLRRPSALKPIHCPSGEKNGSVAPSVPSIGVDSRDPISRLNSMAFPSWRPGKTMVRPSGENAKSESPPTPNS